MKFKIFLNEEINTVDNIFKVLERDCSEMLKVIKKVRKFIYRGSDKNVKYMKVVTPRKTRRPKDMPTEAHYALDEEFKRRFGWFVRSEGVFATSRGGDAGSYGYDYYIFFPFDGYKYVWSPTYRDLYSDTSDGMDFFIEPGEDEDEYQDDSWGEMVIDDDKVYNVVKRYQDNNLEGAIEKGNEISFKCSKYYLISRGFIHDILDKLEK